MRFASVLAESSLKMLVSRSEGLISSRALVTRAVELTNSTKKAEVSGMKKHCHFTEEEIRLVLMNLSKTPWKVVRPKVGKTMVTNQLYQKDLEKMR